MFVYIALFWLKYAKLVGFFAVCFFDKKIGGSFGKKWTQRNVQEKKQMFGTVDLSIQSVGLAFVCVPRKFVWDACFWTYPLV